MFKFGIIRRRRAFNDHSRSLRLLEILVPVVRVAQVAIVDFSIWTFSTGAAVADEIIAGAAAADPTHPAETIQLLE